jgi:tetratricopeptide (TPR) repeat protein
MPTTRLHSLLLAATALASLAAVPAAAQLCGPGDPAAGRLPAPLVRLAQASPELFRPGTAAAPTAAAAPGPAPTLRDDLGDHSFRVTTAVPLAQRWFDQGLILAWGFNHEEARRAFREAQRLDPACAICAWGEAFVLGPNINAPMPAAAVPEAMAAIARAERLAGAARPLERALIQALARRYAADPAADRAALDRAYAEAMTEVAAAFPAVDEVQVLLADALMNLQPWDYWQADRATPKGRTAEQLAALETVLARNPDHPGAIHLYIHTVEASSAPERAAPFAERLGALVPGAGHLVHMPAHIWYRIGRYADSLEANVRAVAADEAYLAATTGNDAYRYTYYPHNVHFLLVSAQMAGARATAVAAAEKLARVLSDEVAEEVPWVQAIKTAPDFLHAQMSEPAAILARPHPGGRFPLVLGTWHYARGVALALDGRIGEARAEQAAIARIRAETDFAALEAGGLPASAVLEIAELVLEGRIAQAGGRHGEAAAAFERAALVETALAYQEPPYWYYPVDQSLGQALLDAGRPGEAAAAFERALARAPHNGWALSGLARARERSGEAAAARTARERFARAWQGDPRGPDPRRL